MHVPLGPFPVVFGGAPIGGLYAPVSDDAAAETLEAAWEAGILATWRATTKTDHKISRVRSMVTTAV